MVGLVPICRCNGGGFMSFRGAVSSSHCLLHKALTVVGLVPICRCKGGLLGLRPSTLPISRLFLVG